MRDETERLVAAMGIAIQAGVPVLLWGEPGTGKSASIASVCRELGRPLETVIGSIRDATDIGGLPVRTDSGVSLVPPDWAVRSSEFGRSVILFDELTTCAADVQAAILSVVLERRVGSLKLPESVSFVAAANPAGSGGFRPLSPPLANRFCHLEWVADPHAWAVAFRGGWPRPILPKVPPERETSTRTWTDRVATFISRRPELLQSPVHQDRSRAWASPRSWAMARHLAAAAEAACAPVDVLFLLVAGCVGHGAAVEFLAFVADDDLVDPETALARPHDVAIPERADRCHALLQSVVDCLGDRPTQTRWNAAWSLVARVARVRGADAAFVAGRQLAKVRDLQWAAPEDADVFEPLLAGSTR